MTKLRDLKNDLSYLELEGQGRGIIMEVTRPLFLRLFYYSEVPNRRADRNKRAGLEKKCHPACLLLSKSINEQGGIFRLLHEKLRAGWKENLKNLSEHALLLGTSE